MLDNHLTNRGEIVFQNNIIENICAVIVKKIPRNYQGTLSNYRKCYAAIFSFFLLI